MHAISLLSPKEGNVVAQNSSGLREMFVKWMAQALVKGKVQRLTCRPLEGAREVDAQNFAEITEKYGMQAWGW
jgi:hypothetical protein